MLSEEEESKLNNWLVQISLIPNLDTQMCYWMTAREFKWLAENLKKVDTEYKLWKKEHDYGTEHFSSKWYPR